MWVRVPPGAQTNTSVAQLVELAALNREVVGSSPTGGTNFGRAFNLSFILLYYLYMKCGFCHKECPNENSLRNHERLCKGNPNRQQSNLTEYFKPGHVAWNKGLTKESDERVAQYGKTYSNRIKSGEITCWVTGLSKETDERLQKLSQKVSNTIKNKVSKNEWHKSLGKKKRIQYKDIWLDSTWEAIVAKYLDDNNIDWIVPSISFEYELDGEKHQYYPDFYLPQYNRYIEVKGYERRKDLVKYTTIPNLIILKYKEIKQIQDSKFNIFDILGNVA